MAWGASRRRAAVGLLPHGKAHGGRSSAMTALLMHVVVHVGGCAKAAVGER